jgi:hypothetical protein
MMRLRLQVRKLNKAMHKNSTFEVIIFGQNETEADRPAFNQRWNS